MGIDPPALPAQQKANGLDDVHFILDQQNMSVHAPVSSPVRVAFCLFMRALNYVQFLRRLSKPSEAFAQDRRLAPAVASAPGANPARGPHFDGRVPGLLVRSRNGNDQHRGLDQGGRVNRHRTSDLRGCETVEHRLGPPRHLDPLAHHMPRMSNHLKERPKRARSPIARDGKTAGRLAKQQRARAVGDDKAQTEARHRCQTAHYGDHRRIKMPRQCHRIRTDGRQSRGQVGHLHPLAVVNDPFQHVLGNVAGRMRRQFRRALDQIGGPCATCLQFSKAELMRRNECLNLFLRRTGNRRLTGFGIEKPDKGFGTGRKAAAVLVDVGVKAVAPGRIEVFVLKQDRGGGPDGGSGGQHLMHGGGKLGVVGQPVTERLDRMFQTGGLAMRGGQGIGPARKAARKFLGTVHLGLGHARAMCGVPQRSDQRGLRPLGQG
mmetsp:Transcript_23274/g.40191  ORF Transcript_23274/g.40191 Transcript_23274/m.40191 type:complete len:433 (-) Transcript_23274:268-1566(-)